MTGVRKPWSAAIRRIASSWTYEHNAEGVPVTTHPHISILTQITEGPSKEKNRLVFLRLTADEFDELLPEMLKARDETRQQEAKVATPQEDE